MLIDARTLNNEFVFNQMIPEEGPRALPLVIDFSVAQSFDLDLSMLQTQGRFSMLQTIFIDAASAINLPNGDVAITIEGSGQVITMAPGQQGYFSVICPNPIKLNIAGGSDTGIANIFLLNVAIPGSVWTL